MANDGLMSSQQQHQNQSYHERIPIRGKKQRALAFPVQARQVLLSGAAGRSRTGDLRITNALLYQLSYSGVGAHYKAGTPLLTTRPSAPLLYLTLHTSTQRRKFNDF